MATEPLLESIALRTAANQSALVRRLAANKTISSTVRQVSSTVTGQRNLPQ